MNEPLFQGPLERPQFLKRSEPLPASGTRTRSLQALAGAFLTAGLAQISMPSTGLATASESTYVYKVDVSTCRQAVEAADIPADEQLLLAWEAYRKNLNKVLKGPHARKVRSFWSDLCGKAEPSVPLAGPTEEQSFAMSWDDGERYCEVEIHADGRYEWFYCDRTKDHHEGAMGSREQALVAIASYLDLLKLA